MARVYVLLRSWYLLVGAVAGIASLAALFTGPGIEGSLLLLTGGAFCMLIARS